MIFKRKAKIFFEVVILLFTTSYSNAQNEKQTDRSFAVFDDQNTLDIIYSSENLGLDSLSAHLLSEDIFKLTSNKPKIGHQFQASNENVIAIGQLSSSLMGKLLENEKLPKKFSTQRESYLYKIVEHPINPGQQVFIIAGTDARGTAYGVLELSKKMGISPWYWWADVPVAKKSQFLIEEQGFYSKEPSVEYRGIFLNDEDWGLQPWAAKTFEPETGDIGPKTYAKLFELLLRLKANTIWPAMHPSTKAFFHYPDNKNTAQKYHIVLGSSHAEPMLRNNVDEWQKETMGSFNYLDNKNTVFNYWKERVKNTAELDAIYTLGMRGIHDSGMEGVKNINEATQLLSTVIDDQRSLIETYHNDSVTNVPQTFTVYKEVLDLYDHGLKLPEDITITWTDDNYGYIRRLSSLSERNRPGGGGIYYHASYWGRPHDYLWLSTTSPGLIREEMMKAYNTESRKMWILNVGDIKPAEYNLQLFMDMAWDTSKFQKSEYLQEHQEAFFDATFNKDLGRSISEIKTKFYQLAYERKPEFMGWSQTEPTTETKQTAYSPFHWGDEIAKRVSKYDRLEQEVDSLYKRIPANFRDAYFQLVYYPVRSAALMNKKWLYHDKAEKYKLQNRLSAEDYHKHSLEAYDSIKKLTSDYNHKIADGKWNHIMDMKPRNLPVFQKPDFLASQGVATEGAGVSVENAGSEKPYNLPDFYKNLPEEHFIDLFLTNNQPISWTMVYAPSWVTISKGTGILNKENAEERLQVSIDYDEWMKQQSPERDTIQLKINEELYKFPLKVNGFNSKFSIKNDVFIVKNGIAVLYAEDYQNVQNKGTNHWSTINDLGYSGKVMLSGPAQLFPIDTTRLSKNAPRLSYELFTEKTKDSVTLQINILPTHPITKHHYVRLGVQLDNDPIKILNFETYGRSEIWKLNVLRNSAIRHIKYPPLAEGSHKITIYMIDQGVSLDYMYLKTDQAAAFPYSLLPQTLVH